MNWVEDNLIKQIDLSRSGIDLVQIDEERADYEIYRRFYLRQAERSFEQAQNEKFIGKTGAQLALEVRLLARRLGLARTELIEFTARNEISRRRMRKLSKDDEDGDLQNILRRLEKKVADLETEYRETVECLDARRFLKEQPDLVAMALNLQRKSDLTLAMEKLKKMYRET